jgi:peptide/nickel transport system permease protein
VKKGEAADEVSRVAALMGIATPNFWLGLMLLLVFSVQLDLFRVIPPDAPLLSTAMFKFMILPAITLGTASSALLMRLTRSSMVEELNKEYVRMARAKGLSERTVVVKHVLRNSLISVVTVAALQVAFLVDGAVVVEQVFSWPGVGRLLIQSILQRDFPIIQAVVLLIATTIVFANLAADIVYSWLDPRIRY